MLTGRRERGQGIPTFLSSHYFSSVSLLRFPSHCRQSSSSSSSSSSLAGPPGKRLGAGGGCLFFCNRRKKRGLFFSSSLALRAVIAVVAENVVMTAVRVQELVGSLGFFLLTFFPRGLQRRRRKRNDKKIIAKKERGNASCSVPN